MRHWHSLALIGVLFVILCSPAAADRYHVSSGGLRTTGPSTPGDWSPENCYANLSTALSATAAADSVLLARQIHTLASAHDLPAYLGNADLDDDAANCTVIMSTGATLNACVVTASCTVKGLQFLGSGSGRSVSALRIDNVAATGQSLTLEGCHFNQFNGGHADGGSCLSAVRGNGLAITITGCEFASNQTGRRGGAIHAGDDFTVTVTGGLFHNNMTTSGISSSAFGGAISVDSPTAPTHLAIDGTVFIGNKSALIGGTICVLEGSLTAENITMTGSRSAWDGLSNWCAGAGIMLRRNEGTHTQPIDLIIRGSHFEDNVGNLEAGDGAGDGGAVMVRGSLGHMIDVTVEHCEFVDNYNDQGAGLYIGRFTNGVVNYCRFEGNRTRNSGGATFKGGGLAENLGETAVYTYCEFIDNMAGVNELGTSVWEYARGGAFSTREAPRAEFYQCTFVNNVAAGASPNGDAVSLIDEAGSFDSDLERCVMVNCVFWGQEGRDKQVRSDALGFSRVENCAWEADEFTCGGFTPVGTVQLTAFPFTGYNPPSPVINGQLVDAGVDLGLSPDLAGQAVPQGLGPDIGAYEYITVTDAAVPPPVRSMHLSAQPNPFNPAVTVACELAFSSQVTVEVLDLRGRRVATLHQGHLDAGRHQWRWNGRDQSGRVLPAGTYLARAQGPAAVDSLKLLLVK